MGRKVTAESGAPARAPGATDALAAGTLLLAVLILAEWSIGRLALSQIRPSFIPMAPSTAAAFAAIALALLLRKRPAPAALFAVLPLVCASLILLQIPLGAAAGRPFDIEGLFVRSPGELRGQPIGRMSPLTAVLFILASASILARLRSGESRRSTRNATDLLAGLGLAASGVLLLGYWYRLPLLYGGGMIPVALPTAVGFALVNLAILLDGPEAPLSRWLSSDAVSAQLTRLVVPGAAGVVLLVGWAGPSLEGTPFVLWHAASASVAVVLVGCLAAWSARRVEAALLERQERYRALFERSRDAVFVADEETGRILDANEEAARLLGRPRGEILGMHQTELHPPEERERHRGIFRALAVAGGEPVEAVILSADGRRISVEITPTLVDLGRGERVVQGIFRDISERKRVEEERKRLIEELEARNAELERYVYTVSHDLKSPIITIEGFADLLRQGRDAGDESRTDHCLDRIASSARRMRGLLEDLLALARIGRACAPPAPVPFGEVVEEALARTAGPLDRGGVRVAAAPDLPTVLGDRTRLAEVVQNLVENAVKFMGDRPDPAIEIGARIERDEAVCFVKDNGIGIDPRHREEVFGLFNKLDSKSEGSGVGLALVKRTIEFHGGRVWIETNDSGGTTFFFSLPLAERPASAAAGTGQA